MPLFVAMLFVIAASVIISQYMVRRQASDVYGAQTVSVLFTANKIDQGDWIQSDDIEVRQIPAQYVHVRTVPAHLKHMVVDRMSVATLDKGEPLLWDAIYMDEADPLSNQVGLSERAVTIPVDELNSFNGLINPGDRVDIMAVMHPSKLDEEATLTPLLQNISVLAVNNRTSKRPTRVNTALSPEGTHTLAQTITVKVSPNDAALLAYAQTQGRIIVSLRNPNDIFSSNIPQVNQSNIKQFVGSAYNYPTLPFDRSKNAPYIHKEATPLYADDDNHVSQKFFQQVNAFNQSLAAEILN